MALDDGEMTTHWTCFADSVGWHGKGNGNGNGVVYDEAFSLDSSTCRIRVNFIRRIMPSILFVVIKVTFEQTHSMGPIE